MKKTYKGRLPVLSGEQIATARASLVLKVPKAQIVRDLGVSRSALYDALGSRGAYVTRSPITADPVQPPQVTAASAPTAALQTVPGVAPEVVAEPHSVDLPAEPVEVGEPARELPSLASSTSAAAKQPRAPRAPRKRWFVVEAAAAEADDVGAEVVIMSASKTAAERVRRRLQVKARGDLSREEVVAVRGEDQVRRYRAWDATLGRGVTKQGPPPR